MQTEKVLDLNRYQLIQAFKEMMFLKVAQMNGSLAVQVMPHV